ncbi:MAG: heavy metal-binding domain-containing protein [Verrucomicrobiota bacterium]
MIELILGLVTFGFFIGLGFFIGGWNERNHFQQLAAAEEQYKHILVSDQKRLPEAWNASHPVMVVGSVVVATDYFKTFAASLRTLFGGRIVSLERLVERGRREAVVRMLEQAHHASANVIWNVRVETSCIGMNEKKSASGIEVVAYGTAMRVQ